MCCFGQVTFLMMPLEIAWAATVSWEAGDAMCRIMAFFRTFGLYLSSFIIICISIDRYYAVMRPLQVLDVYKRGKIMLMIAWMSSVLCSLPQMLVFHVEKHPNFTCFTQCVTFNTFPSYMPEVSYNLFSMVAMYCLPLVVIFYTYTSIFLEICRRSQENGEGKLRRSSIGFLNRARVRTLKMTITIIVVFIVCWTPYYVMSVWYWIDRSSAREIDERIQRALFFFACTNSSMNPIIYGIFNIRQRNKAPTRTATIETRITPLSLSVRILDWRWTRRSPDRTDAFRRVKNRQMSSSLFATLFLRNNQITSQYTTYRRPLWIPSKRQCKSVQRRAIHRTLKKFLIHIRIINTFRVLTLFSRLFIGGQTHKELQNLEETFIIINILLWTCYYLISNSFTYLNIFTHFCIVFHWTRTRLCNKMKITKMAWNRKISTKVTNNPRITERVEQQR